MAMQRQDEPLMRLRGIRKSFNIGLENELEILHGLDMDIYEGEFVALVGQSGSGKSTLMNIIGALDRPTEGTYTLGGLDIGNAPDSALSTVRSRLVGFVFQTFNLIPRNSALKNVELPMLYAGVPPAERRERAMHLLDMVGMADRADHQPNALSGGQKQRVAIARAMANDPAIILADEPTGALDSETGRMVMDIFHRLNKEQGKTIILITHNPELAAECSRTYTLLDGYFVSEDVAKKMGLVTQDKREQLEVQTEEDGAEAKADEEKTEAEAESIDQEEASEALLEDKTQEEPKEEQLVEEEHKGGADNEPT